MELFILLLNLHDRTKSQEPRPEFFFKWETYTYFFTQEGLNPHQHR